MQGDINSAKKENETLVSKFTLR